MVWTPTPSPLHLKKAGFFKLMEWTVSNLFHKGIDVGGIGQNLLRDFFACANTQAGKMRVDLQRLIAVLNGKEPTLTFQATKDGRHWSHHEATLKETADLLKDVRTGIRELFVNETEVQVRFAKASGVYNLSAEEMLGMLAGEFYARNRSGNDKLIPFLAAIEAHLPHKLEEPVNYYIGAGIAYRRRATEIANINAYIEAVAEKFDVSVSEDKLALNSRIAFAIIDMGTFDPALPVELVKHNKFAVAQAAKMAAAIFSARREDAGKTEQHILKWGEKAGYDVPQTAVFLAELASELGYDAAGAARLIAYAARRNHYKSAEIARLAGEAITKLGLKRPQKVQFVAELAKLGLGRDADITEIVAHQTQARNYEEPAAGELAAALVIGVHRQPKKDWVRQVILDIARKLDYSAQETGRFAMSVTKSLIWDNPTERLRYVDGIRKERQTELLPSHLALFKSLLKKEKE
jgi:hypothetical protein